MSQTHYSNDDSPGFIYRKNLKFRSNPSDCYLGVSNNLLNYSQKGDQKRLSQNIRPRFDLYHLVIALLTFWSTSHKFTSFILIF